MSGERTTERSRIGLPPRSQLEREALRDERLRFGDRGRDPMEQGIDRLLAIAIVGELDRRIREMQNAIRSVTATKYSNDGRDRGAGHVAQHSIVESF